MVRARIGIRNRDLIALIRIERYRMIHARSLCARNHVHRSLVHSNRILIAISEQFDQCDILTQSAGRTCATSNQDLAIRKRQYRLARLIVLR